MPDRESKKPTETKRFDRVHVAIWQNEGKYDEGEERKDYWTFTASRSSKGDDGQWRRVYSFTERDLPHLALAIEWAMVQLNLKSQ